jgi:uncharacterized protein (TIGR02118 family)
MEESSAERPNEIPGSCGFLLTIAARSSTPASVHHRKLRVGFDGRSARPEWEVQSLHRDTFLPRPVLPDTAISARLASGSAASSGGTSMILVSVMYPGGPNATFDEAYYLGTHIPLVKERWTSMGLEEVRLVKGRNTPDGSPPLYPVMALLTFRSLQDFQSASGAHGAEIFADIPKFTNVQPILQISEPLE